MIIGTLRQDIRYGARSLVKRPGFAAIVMLTLALAIGANAVIFSVVNSVLLRPLPYEDAERLVRVNRFDVKRGKLGANTSPLNFLDWRSQNNTFENLGGYMEIDFNLSGSVEPQRIPGAFVSDTMFPALGAKPIVGRSFLPEEDRKGGQSVVMLSHSLWLKQFGGRTDVVGQVITLDGKSHTVVGVMPAAFNFPSNQAALWVPFGSIYEDGGRGNFFVNVVGKIRPNVSVAEAQSDLNVIAANLERLYPEVNTDSRVAVTPLHEEITGKVRGTLLLLLGAVGFTLLIACANVANLLLARAAVRAKEFALRSALGASRLRIMGQLLTESLLLSLGGTALGLFIAYAGTRAIVASGVADFPRLQEIAIDGRVLGFTLGLVIVTTLLFGLAPALQASNPNLIDALRAGARNITGSNSVLRASLVVTEIALSLVLLIGAGLLLRSFWRVVNVNPGFTTENVLTFDVSLPDEKYDRQQATAFFERALQNIRALPGVVSAGATTMLPLSMENNARYFTVEGRTGNEPRDYTIASHRQVSAGYFETLQFTLLKGRFLTEQDSGTETPAVVVNQAFARKYFSDQDPIGKRMKMGETADSSFPWMTVVGVVGDVRHASLEMQGSPEFYRPFLNNRDMSRKMTFAVRTTQPPELLTASLRRQILELDPNQPIGNVRTLEQSVERSVAARRFVMWLLGLFAATALLLATVGIYGVMSYTVSQNTREIGIRRALGAQTLDVLRLIVGHGMLLAIAGVLLGLLGAFGLTRLMVSLLFEVKATDQLTFAMVTLLLIGVAFLACYLPARRASKVDPLIALRHE
jgi:putative ABC transport system permease protein